VICCPGTDDSKPEDGNLGKGRSLAHMDHLRAGFSLCKPDSTATEHGAFFERALVQAGTGDMLVNKL
tara:strand:- start:380 stop:580 length:201 start_codon:yes stop_codon:yes gene_type:complete